MNLKEAKAIAFGSRPADTLANYYAAWQWLYDNISNAGLRHADLIYLDKLICDGIIETKDGWDESIIDKED